MWTDTTRNPPPKVGESPGMTTSQPGAFARFVAYMTTDLARKMETSSRPEVAPSKWLFASVRRDIREFRLMQWLPLRRQIG